MNGGNMEQYIYRADVWCHNCAEKIKLSQAASTNRPPNPEDETSYDSDVWPKGPYEDQESDSPEHCAGCGLFLENPLTQAGYRYVQEKLNEYGAKLPDVAQEWADFYGFEYEPGGASKFATAHEWLASKDICTYLRSLLDQIDGDTIQDTFQNEMDEDGFFKKAGWYSVEMVQD